ncbi:DUF4815 domain-containing protein [Azospirillum sp. TSH64]|uniref:DUF4815 domain-containing protein n=1 Tax=Azospirillum sp. TSH64 TaxID=652740 RepID=UPI000D606880|nr:DUF4815 domain-containing protein [Azospirillum sp. TSH64]PWC81250.1 hypothetical protein TSH64_00980 [Azospirillum sp. TSH64]
MALEEYYNRFDPAKGYDSIQFVARRGLQSAELNESQAILADRIKNIADVLFKEGDVVRDAACAVNPDTGAVTLAAGAVYLVGAIRAVGGASFTIPVNRTVAVGVRMIETTVTELEDPELRDPAVGTRNYQEAGAGRLKRSIAWAWDADGGAGQFYPIYAIENGVLLNRSAPPELDSVAIALARYDVEANGNYVVSGFRVHALAVDGAEQVFSIEEGTANIEGFKTSRATSTRIRYPVDPDIESINSEPHSYSTANGGAQRITLNHTPIKTIRDVVITAQKVVTLTHGTFTNAADTLPDPTVVEIVAVNQGGTWSGSAFTGGTTYAVGTSYFRNADRVDWSPSGGPEPAPGSSYTVVYRYLTSVSPTAVDDDGFTVSGAVSGSLVLVDYDWKLPRVDALALNRNGEIVRVKGLSHSIRPAAPSLPASLLGIAEISQAWRSALPTVRNNAVRAVPMASLEEMGRRIDDLFSLVAEERLRTDIASREPASKRGVFVDPFIDNDLRDQGTAQTAAIIDGELMLPIEAAILDPTGSDRVTLTFDLEAALEQTKRSGFMLINPYMAFEPIPAVVTLTPEVDFWTRTDTVFTSDSTERFVQTGHFVPGVSTAVSRSTSVSDTVVSQSSADVEFLRQITVNFKASGFGPGEELVEVLFDGINVTPSA